VGPLEVCGGRSGNETGFHPVILFPLTVFFHRASIFLFIFKLFLSKEKAYLKVQFLLTEKAVLSHFKHQSPSYVTEIIKFVFRMTTNT
jgi:hypothetical protein